MTVSLFLVQLKKRILKSLLSLSINRVDASKEHKRRGKNAEVLQVEGESDDPEATFPVMAICICGYAGGAGHTRPEPHRGIWLRVAAACSCFVQACVGREPRVGCAAAQQGRKHETAPASHDSICSLW